MKASRNMRRLATVAAAVPAILMFATSNAYAAVNDNFTAKTSDQCGTANFIDYGPGAPGGGNNDDYVVIHDYCADGLGVQAFVWINGEYWGDEYNGNGSSGAATVWDPFRLYGPANLSAGDGVKIKVCLMNGNHPNEDHLGIRCGTAEHTMADG